LSLRCTGRKAGFSFVPDSLASLEDGDFGSYSINYIL